MKSLCLQARGEVFSKRETNVDAAAMTFSTRGCVNHWRIEGDFREYEAAFELTKLWTDDEAVGIDLDPDLGNRAHSDYDLSLDHVHRQWGLNEDAAWEDRDAFDFADLLGEGIWTKRRRRFLAPYSETDDECRKVIVEVQSAELTTGWHRVASGNVRLLTDRCGIYFDLTDLDGSNSRLVTDDGTTLALIDVSAVRVTAIVQSDERVAYDAEREESAGSSQTVTETIQSGRFRRVSRDSSSAYAGEGTGLLRDDGADDGPMRSLAANLREGAEPLDKRVSASVPWVDLSLRAGERVEGIDGRGLSLGGAGESAACRPLLEAVTYDFVGQRTDLALRVISE